MNKYQEVMLGCLNEFIRVANEQGFEWWADGGTLLGAIREKGFIEWDTDADVIVPREVYDKIKTHPEWFKEPYVFEDYHNTHLKIHDTRTTSYVKGWDRVKDGNPHGINIDIFALDEIGGDYVGDLSFGIRPNCIWKKSWWESYEMKPFENIELRVPCGAEQILEKQYGEWRVPKDGGGHHDNSLVYMSLEKEW